MSGNVVERLHDEFDALRGFLQDNDGAHLLPIVEENFPKALLLAAASHFEKRLTEAVKEFAREVTTVDHPLVSLIETKAVERQYHTWFDWDKRNANKFFRLFGNAFRQHAEKKVDRNDLLNESIRAFLDIGRERNELVHEDFAGFQMNKTSEEIYGLYRSAAVFVDWFPQVIREFSPDGRAGGPEPGASAPPATDGSPSGSSMA